MTINSTTVTTPTHHRLNPSPIAITSFILTHPHLPSSDHTHPHLSTSFPTCPHLSLPNQTHLQMTRSNLTITVITNHHTLTLSCTLVMASSACFRLSILSSSLFCCSLANSKIRLFSSSINCCSCFFH